MMRLFTLTLEQTTTRTQQWVKDRGIPQPQSPPPGYSNATFQLRFGFRGRGIKYE